MLERKVLGTVTMTRTEAALSPSGVRSRSTPRCGFRTARIHLKAVKEPNRFLGLRFSALRAIAKHDAEAVRWVRWTDHVLEKAFSLQKTGLLPRSATAMLMSRVATQMRKT